MFQMLQKDTFNEIIKNAEKVYYAKVGNAFMKTQREFRLGTLDVSVEKEKLNEYRKSFSHQQIKTLFDESTIVKETKFVYYSKKINKKDSEMFKLLVNSKEDLLFASFTDPILKIHMTLPKKNQPMALLKYSFRGEKGQISTEFDIFSFVIG